MQDDITPFIAIGERGAVISPLPLRTARLEEDGEIIVASIRMTLAFFTYELASLHPALTQGWRWNIDGFLGVHRDFLDYDRFNATFSAWIIFVDDVDSSFTITLIFSGVNIEQVLLETEIYHFRASIHLITMCVHKWYVLGYLCKNLQVSDLLEAVRSLFDFQLDSKKDVLAIIVKE